MGTLYSQANPRLTAREPYSKKSSKKSPAALVVVMTPTLTPIRAEVEEEEEVRGIPGVWNPGEATSRASVEEVAVTPTSKEAEVVETTSEEEEAEETVEQITTAAAVVEEAPVVIMAASRAIRAEEAKSPTPMEATKEANQTKEEGVGTSPIIDTQEIPDSHTSSIMLADMPDIIEIPMPW